MTLATLTRNTNSQTTVEPAAQTRSQQSAARGFGLYIGLTEEQAAASGKTLAKVVAALKQTLTELVPAADAHAVVALAAKDAPGRNIDIVRLALHDPAAIKQRDANRDRLDKTGVLIDTTRNQIFLDGNKAQLTYREFEILLFLVLREGQTISRQQLIDELWSADDLDLPVVRTIDVHIRRLRSKLGDYADIISTVRSIGYRFDRHADVNIRTGQTKSPDVF